MHIYLLTLLHLLPKTHTHTTTPPLHNTNNPEHKGYRPGKPRKRTYRCTRAGYIANLATLYVSNTTLHGYNSFAKNNAAEKRVVIVVGI